jgi:hypothetical protein
MSEHFRAGLGTVWPGTRLIMIAATFGFALAAAGVPTVVASAQRAGLVTRDVQIGQAPTTRPLSKSTAAELAERRAWVRGQATAGAAKKYRTVDGKLALIEAIIRNGKIKKHETWKWESLGVVFGDALVQKMKLRWIEAEDNIGMDPGIQDERLLIVLFPKDMLIKRIERNETLDVRQLFAAMCKLVEDYRKVAKPRSAN